MRKIRAAVIIGFAVFGVIGLVDFLFIGSRITLWVVAFILLVIHEVLRMWEERA